MTEKSTKPGRSERMALGGETQVEDLGYAIYRPFPNTNQVLMPFHGKGAWSITSASTTAGLDWIKIRLNSIADIFNSAATRTEITVDPVTEDTLAGTATTPIMRDYWASIYKYYHVVACKYKVTYHMQTTSRTKAQAMVYEYMHGQQDPPITDGGSTNIIPHAYRQHHPHVRCKTLNTNGGFGQQEIDVPGTTTDPTTDLFGIEPFQPNWVNNSVTFEGIWKPGMVKHEVIEDELNEVWTTFAKTPKQYENLTFMITHSPYGEGVVNMQGDIYVDLEYVVQLKDLKLAYQYINNETSIAAVTNYSNQTNSTSMEA